MRKLTRISLAILGLIGFASAQITLLHTFDEAVFPLVEEFEFVGNLHFLDFTGYVALYDERTIRVFNEDFSLRAAMVAPEGFDGHVAALSQRVFDLDDRLEYLAYIDDWNEYGQLLRLYNESGQRLMDFGRVQNAVLFITSSGEYRLMILRGSWNTRRFTTEIYGLPGRSDGSISISPSRAVRNNSMVRFAGIRNGQIQLNLTAGKYTAQLLNPQGRLINSVDFNATNGINSIGLRTDNLARGVFILNVERAGVSVLNQRITVD